MDELGELQSWYQAQCDGDWEHSWGVQIETLDNPGWQLRIDLTATDRFGLPFERVEVDNHDLGWMHCWVEGGVFHAAGGPQMLRPMLRIFLDWPRVAGN